MSLTKRHKVNVSSRSLMPTQTNKSRRSTISSKKLKRSKRSKHNKAGCFSCKKCDECMRVAIENYFENEYKDSNFNNYPLHPPSPKRMDRPNLKIHKPFPRTRVKVRKAGMPTNTIKNRQRRKR